MKIILGSTSPRRKEILNFFTLPFEQIGPDFDEKSLPFLDDPAAFVNALATGKAKSLSNKYPNRTILTADTIVYMDGQVLGKPENESEMIAMLQALSGRWHSVWTGVCIQCQKGSFCQAEETRVLCNKTTPDELHRYMRSHALFDKAGSYAIQKSGSILVNKIDGCYHNVCGLPINALTAMLKHANIDLWDYLQEFE